MKKSILLGLFLCLSGILHLNAQLIATTPSIVTETGAVEIVFDASKGTAGLKDYTGDVYAHTGVITSKSTSSSDWKYVKAGWSENIPDCKMTSLGNNQWKLTISLDIRAYYKITDASESVKQLAFVFRSADGGKEGKDTGGKDILVEVHPPGLTVLFTEPAQETTIVEAGSTVHFSVQASTVTNIICRMNGAQVSVGGNTDHWAFDQQFTAPGKYEMVVQAGSDPNPPSDTVVVFVRSEVTEAPRPAGIRPGINIKDGVVTLCLYAPYKNNVFIVGDFNSWELNNNYLMKKDGDYWWLTLPAVVSGTEYAYQYLVDGNLSIADPYADKVLDPWNDKYIPSSVYPNLKAYPEGKTTGIVSVLQAGQTAYNWTITDFNPVSEEKLVVYELLVRDFTEEHSFKAAAQKLDYLQELGINAIELMPVNEFEGNDSWGYNPSFYFAVDKYYGTKNDFKSFVDQCHQRGIAVIMDMVLNHSYGQSPFVQLYWNSTNNTPAANNPWYNVTSPNPVYSWGYDFNHQSAHTQALVDSINSYWMQEYKVDGFRFDFTKGFTNKPGDGWSYDASRIQILKRMASEIVKRKQDAIVIFEHLTETSEEIELADDGILLWGNMNNPYCEASMGYNESSKSDLSNAIYKKRGFHQPNLLAYMESHDEERMMYKAVTYGNSGTGYNVKALATALDRAELSASFYLLFPGPKMIWQFGELGYDYSINTCADGTVSDNCRLVPKPVRWDYASDPDRKALYEKYSGLNYLKQHYPVFSTTDFTYSLAGSAKSFVWKTNDMNAFAIGNFDIKALPVTVTLPKTGTWYDVFSGKTITVSSTSYTVTLQAGEYHLYTDIKMDLPAGIEPILPGKQQPISIYPNPADDVLHLSGVDRVNEIIVLSLQGQVIRKTQNSGQIDVSGLKTGIYLLQLKNNNAIEILKFLKK